MIVALGFVGKKKPAQWPACYLLILKSKTLIIKRCANLVFVKAKAFSSVLHPAYIGLPLVRRDLIGGAERAELAR